MPLELSEPLRAALFDLDGTLLDTAPDMAAALNALRIEQHEQPIEFARIRLQVSNGAAAVVRVGFPGADAARAEQLRLRFLDIYARQLADQTRLFRGFDEVLGTLEAHGIPWGVVTNKPAYLTEPLLAALNLSARAACVVSGDTLAERKPHPAPLRLAAERIGIPAEQCLYLGDALRDVQAAIAARMLPLGARFGYLDAAEEPERWPVAGWIDRPAELLPWLGLRLHS
jgi:N-acetyl-D-muramate 6-phosphate phosphatase